MTRENPLTQAEIEELNALEKKGGREFLYAVHNAWPRIKALAQAQTRMERHHKQCPAFRGEEICECDANYAYAKLESMYLPKGETLDR